MKSQHPAYSPYSPKFLCQLTEGTACIPQEFCPQPFTVHSQVRMYIANYYDENTYVNYCTLTLDDNFLNNDFDSGKVVSVASSSNLLTKSDGKHYMHKHTYIMKIHM